MNTLDIATACGVNPRKVTHGEYASGCPMCGGNDRFRVWPEKGEYGKWWCRGCNKGGDAVQLLIDKKGMTFKDACAYIGKEVKRRSRTPVAPRKAAVEFTPRQTASPAELWQQRAAEFAEASHKVLLATPDQLAWLAARGITVETVTRFKLGWNIKKVYGKRAEWGVDNETAKNEAGEEKVLDLLVLHRGLVIPYIADGRVESLRIRRPEEGLDDRYRHIKGSSTKPMMIRSENDPQRGVGAWIMVESRLDAILIAQDAGDLVSVAALDSVATKPDGTLYDELRKADHIMNAVDFDTAGGKAGHWWKEHFPQADRWPVPRGKDPGDYKKEGGDIRAWIIAGLPYGLRPSPAHSPSPQQGDGMGEGECTPAPALITLPAPANRSEPLKHDSQFDKKACLPVSDKGLDGYIIDEAQCEVCGRPLTVSWPQKTRRPQARCFKCLPENPWDKGSEKREPNGFST